MSYTPADRRNHRAGVDVVRPVKPAPTALDRVHELMRADHKLSRKAAEARVASGATSIGARVTADNGDTPLYSYGLGQLQSLKHWREADAKKRSDCSRGPGKERAGIRGH